MDRTFLFLGALAGLTAVALGAFGAHALRARLSPDMLAVFETGVRYHFYHALALVATGLILGRHDGKLVVDRRLVVCNGDRAVLGQSLRARFDRCDRAGRDHANRRRSVPTGLGLPRNRGLVVADAPFTARVWRFPVRAAADRVDTRSSRC